MSDPLVRTVVDVRYEIRRLIARGGMGLIFEAQHKFTRRIVALKVLSDAMRSMPEAHARLLREAHALTAVRHPGFVEVLDAGECRDHGPYVVLEMLEGRTLDGILAARRRLELEDTMQLGRQVCDAVAHANARGVVHRDIKPSNVFVARNELGQETVKIIDLGVAAVAGAQLAEHDAKLTTAHQVIGTPEYMAPEQLFGREVDARTDVYGIGMTLFECLTGEVPYTGTYPEVLVRVSNATDPPRIQAKRADVPGAITTVIEHALEPQASARFATAAELARALAAASGSAPRPSSLLSLPVPRDGRSDDSESEHAIRLVRRKARPPETPTHQEGNAPIKRRQFVRIPYVTAVRVEPPGGEELGARSEEISEEGILVVLPKTFPVGTRLKLRFASPGTGDNVDIDATVRWTREARGRTATGLQFAEAPPSLRRAVIQYIATISSTET